MTKSKEPYVLEDPQGYTDDAGNYVPTEAEVRSRWEDIHPQKDLSKDEFRMKIWRHPPTRNLVPFYTKEDAQHYQKNSAKSRSNRIQKYKEDKAEKAVMLDVLRDELKNDADDLDPWRLLQLRAKMAVMDEDWDKVEDLSLAMLEYKKPKLGRMDVKTEDVTKGKASNEDMEAFVNDEISYEEFLHRQKGE